MSFAQSKVSTGGAKYVLIEETTGAWCGYCTDGARILDSILRVQPRAIGVAIHDNANNVAGDMTGEDMMETVEGFMLDTTAGYSNGYPNACIDRRGTGNGAVGHHRSQWPSLVAGCLSVRPKFDITLSHSYVDETRTLTITLSAKALAAIQGDYNINVYLTEDNIPSSGPGYAQRSFFYKAPGHPMQGKGIPNADSSVSLLGSSDYRHMHVLRSMLGGTWGMPDIIPSNAPLGTSVSKTFTYTIPDNVVPAHLNIIGIVQKKNIADRNGREIDNAILAHFEPEATSLQGMPPVLRDLNLFPNPANSNLTITATIAGSNTVNIVVKNEVGQTVLTREAKVKGSQLSETIPTDNLGSGIYMLNISCNGNLVSRKFVVCR